MPDTPLYDTFSTVTVTRDDAGAVAKITLFQGDGANRLDAVLIQELTAAFRAVSQDPAVRVVVLAARGASFCAGVDLTWMMQGALAKGEKNRRLAAQLGGLFKTIYDCPVPTVAQVQGSAIGAGLALVCACDMAFAASDALFCSREVRLGILPALMSPYVIAALGPRQAQYLFLTGRELDAARALTAGLVQEVCPRAALDALTQRAVMDLLQGMPESNRATKELVRAVTGRAVCDAVVEDTIDRIAQLRATEQAVAGLTSALQGSAPPWSPAHAPR
jgi:methylglutaconyl-CoA hydratase